jgi:hypothetical protein
MKAMAESDRQENNAAGALVYRLAWLFICSSS